MSYQNVMKFTRQRWMLNDMGINVCYNSKKNTHHAEHVHEFVEMAYILDGQITEYVDGNEYLMKHGQLLFINYNQIHAFKVDKRVRYVDVLLDPAWISDKLINTENAFELLTLSSFSSFADGIDTSRSIVTFEGKERAFMDKMMRVMVDECKNRKVGCDIVLRSFVMMLITMVFRKMFRCEQNEFFISEEFLQYIRDHCDEKLSLTELSRKCYCNPSYFSRMFHKHYGITLTDFILNSRFERACKLLGDSSLSTEEVAVRSGFGNKSTFYKVFREKTGITPGEYRKS